MKSSPHRPSLQLSIVNVLDIRRIALNHLAKEQQHLDIWLFGSRADGGPDLPADVGLYVEAQPKPDVSNQLRCKRALQDKLKLPVDLIISRPDDPTPLARIARRVGFWLHRDPSHPPLPEV